MYNIKRKRMKCKEIVLFLLAPIYYFVYANNKRRLFAANLALKENQSKLYESVLEHFENINLVRTGGLIGYFLKRVDKTFGISLGTTIKYQKVSYHFMILDKVLSFAVNFLIIFYIAWRMLYLNETFGQFLVLRSFFMMALNSVTFFFGFGKTLQEVEVSYSRMKEILDIPKEPVGHENIERIEKISVKELTLHLDNYIIFNNLNVVFSKGNIYVITGPNGSGKTSFAKTLIGLNMDNYEGSITYNELNLRDINHWKLRKDHISFVSQQVDIVLGSYLENILLDQENYDRDYLAELCALFGINNSDNASKGLLSRNIYTSSQKISGGEKRKISLIRGLLKSPELLVLDESESDLDKASRENLIESIEQFKHDRITIIITHNPKFIKIADSVIYLENTNGQRL